MTLKRSISQYDRKANACENRLQRERNKMEKELRPFIKKKALALKHDCSSNQHSFHVNRREHETKRFEQLQDFLNRLSDEMRIQFYFTVKDGKFTWWS